MGIDTQGHMERRNFYRDNGNKDDPVLHLEAHEVGRHFKDIYVVRMFTREDNRATCYRFEYYNRLGKLVFGQRGTLDRVTTSAYWDRGLVPIITYRAFGDWFMADAFDPTLATGDFERKWDDTLRWLARYKAHDGTWDGDPIPPCNRLLEYVTEEVPALEGGSDTDETTGYNT